jgi:signal transduction histidine kinase
LGYYNRKKRIVAKPKRKHASRSTPLKGTQKHTIPCDQLESIFESLPDGVLICDQAGKIVRLNAAAFKLFEVTSSAHWKGTSFQQFLQKYVPCDEQRRPVFPEWLISPVSGNEAGPGSPGKTLILHLPSGQKVSVDFWRFPVFDSKKHAVGTASIFHVIQPRHQKALQLQRVHEAVVTLTNAISNMPEHFDLVTPEGMLLLSPPVIFVAQQLVDVIRQVLDSRRVTLLAHGSEGQEYYIAGSGLTAEQEQYWQKMQGLVLPTEWVDETVLARLSANQEVIIAGDSTKLPLLFRSEFGAQNHLLVPLFLEHQWVGMLSVVKTGRDSEYTPEEVELVKTVAAQTMLVIDGLHWFYEQVAIQARVLMQNEIQRLSNDFLTIASHELFTPLTAIVGNIQLAQRRLEVLKRQLSEQVSEKIEHIQQPLASASQSAWHQKRVINNMIDYARIETKQLRLFMHHGDLGALLKEAITSQQRAVPERTIVLSPPHTEQAVPIFADAKRISQVFNAYLANALKSSPIESPVTVQIAVADATATVLVHDEGPAIPAEVQELLGERFSSARESAVQHELDLSLLQYPATDRRNEENLTPLPASSDAGYSNRTIPNGSSGFTLGLGFSLCRALIEAHHGCVGMQSDPGHGETFWFSLPLAASPGG